MSKKQIGGTHYKKYAIEPWKFIRENNLNPFQANIIRYGVRYEDKNGIEDLEKIIHYCEMEIEILKKKNKDKQKELPAEDSHKATEDWAQMVAQMQDT
jgi:arsenate reductase-like glutaredoxin family protein